MLDIWLVKIYSKKVSFEVDFLDGPQYVNILICQLQKSKVFI